MEKKFKAIVNQAHEYSLLPSDLEQLDLIFEENGGHLIIDKKSIKVKILKTNFINRQYEIKINGNKYQVKIENDLDALIAEMGLSLGDSSVENEVHAPMPGIILEVNVAEGDEVKKGDFLCVLEAMKMENALTASRDGIIKSVHVSKGETVDKGKLLIEFTDDDQ
ncbi:MAG TPA: biotin/lipoyl-containing protein [Aequorivita sp.]|nr:biotin/lipoyl-containing protein [Aequorivita sp.]